MLQFDSKIVTGFSLHLNSSSLAIGHRCFGVERQARHVQRIGIETCAVTRQRIIATAATGQRIIAAAAAGQRKIRQLLVGAVLIYGIVELLSKRFHDRDANGTSPRNMD